jgi:hypothetical protein
LRFSQAFLSSGVHGIYADLGAPDFKKAGGKKP